MDINWRMKIHRIALQDKNWDYWHLAPVKLEGYTLSILAHSHRNFIYCLENSTTLSLQIPSLCKLIDKKFDEMNSYFSIGKVFSVGFFQSFASVRMAVHYDGKIQVYKVTDLEAFIPDVPELIDIAFPEGRNLFIQNNQIVRQNLLAKFNL